MSDPNDPDTLRHAFHRLAATSAPPPRRTDTDLVDYSRRMLTRRRVRLGLLAAAALAIAAWCRTRHRRRTLPATHDAGHLDA
jgi:hypothetical protein